MTRGSRLIAQRLLAALVILALLRLVGVPVVATILFAMVVYFVWRAVQRLDQQEVNRIFEFYLSANDVLHDQERRWFGFEMVEVLERGERVLHSLPDPPVLISFALGALYHSAGKYPEAIEHLTLVVEDVKSDERRITRPSPLLRRYVSTLRRIERNPQEAPQTLAAVGHLEQMRRERAAELLAESRARLPEVGARTNGHQGSLVTSGAETKLQDQPLPRDPDDKRVGAPPRPITEVLRDVYEHDYEN